MRLPSARMPNRELSGSTGEDVILFEVLDVTAGSVVELTFVSEASKYPQGVWLGTEGTLSLAGTKSPQFVIWMSKAPPVSEISVVETDGLLRLYNVWDRLGVAGEAWNSQGRTSGMLRRDLPDGSIEFRCNDLGFDPAFDHLVFRVKVS